MEIEVIHLYDEAANYCVRSRAEELQVLFAGLLQEELGHLRDLDHLLAEIHERAIS